MKKISIVFVAAVSLAAFGCSKKGADCGKAIDKGAELQKAHMAGMDEAMKGNMKNVALSHCKDDKWPDDVLHCMTEAKADTDFKTCQGKLTAEQKSSMQQGMKDLMMANGGAGMAPAGGSGGMAPTAGDGSAAVGSASAGSAAAAGSGDGSAAAFGAEHP